MILKNLAAEGIKRQMAPMADIETIKQYQPTVIASLIFLLEKIGESTSCLFLPKVVPDIILSGYRDHPYDTKVENSPHYFAAAVDLKALSLERQVKIAQLATIETKLFERAGLYPHNGIVHLDVCDKIWREKYRGTKYWVKLNGKYHGYSDLGDATRMASVVKKYKDEIYAFKNMNNMKKYKEN